MFSKYVIYSSSGSGNIIRIFSYQNDGCILYSWRPDANCIKVEQGIEILNSTFVRLFDPSNETDKIILILKGCHEINNASLSPDRKALAYTILEKKTSRRQQVYSVITKHNLLSQDVLKKLVDCHPIKCQNENANELNDSNSETVSLNAPDNKWSDRKPVYNSFLAEVYPTSWSMKFNLDKFLFGSRAVFTNFLVPKVNGDIRITQYKILFIMHREHIGIYSVDIEDLSTQNNSQSESEKPIDPQLIARTRIFNRPVSEVISNHIVWSQWNPSSQQLYYINVIRKERVYPLPKPNLGGIPVKLTCLQFYDKMPHNRVYDISLDMGLSRFSLYSKSLTLHKDLDPTISNKELNIRLFNFNQTGSMCLCWQEMTDKKFKIPEWHYSFVILNKDISVHFPLKENETSFPVTFTPMNQYLVVYCSGEFVHFYDIETMSCDKEGVLNGLNQMFLSDEFVSKSSNFSLEFITNHGYEKSWDNTVESTNMNDEYSDTSSQSSNKQNTSIPNCFDQKSKTFLNIRFDSFVDLFEHKSLTLQNRMLLTRHAVLLSRGNNIFPQLLNKVMETIMCDSTNADATGILAQLIIFRASQELCNNYHTVPHDMIPLFPITPSKKILARLIRKEIPECDLVINYHTVRKTLESEIEQYLATISINNMYMASNMDTTTKTNDKQKNEKLNNPIWYKALSACKSGSFTEYDLDSITEEISFLAKHFRSEESGAQSSLQLHLSKMFKIKFSDPDPPILNPENSEFIGTENVPYLQNSKFELLHKNNLSFFNKYEQDKQSQNIIALTSEKLCDHLSACFNSTKNIATPNYDNLSNDYVHAQVRAVRHILTLMFLKSGVGNVGDFKLYQPASAKEQLLLTALNQFQLVCSLINFPLPNGFHSFITCLTFRMLLAKFSCINRTDGEDGKTVVSEQPDIEIFSEQFFGFVDRGLIQITEEFVAQSLEDLGDKEIYSSVVQKLLEKNGRFYDDHSSVTSLLGLQQQWQDDIPTRKLIDTSLTELYAKDKDFPNQPSSPRSRSTSQNKNEISVKSYLRQQSEKKDSKPALQNEPVSPKLNGSSKTEEPTNIDQLTDFPALNSFMSFISNAEMESDKEKIKLLRQCSSQPIADLVKSTFTEPSIVSALQQQN